MQEEADLVARLPRNLQEAEELIAAIERALSARALALRPPPPAPTTCCGRGCNGCVWEAYYTALRYWQQDAGRLLAAARIIS